MSRDEPARLGYPLGQSATASDLPESSDSVASSRGLFPYLTSVPVAQGGKYPRREDINALIKLLGGYAHFQQGGHIWSFDASLMASGYVAGDVVYYSAPGDLYLSYYNASSGAMELWPVAYVVAQSGLQAGAQYVFIRNSTAYTSGEAAPVYYDSTAEKYVVNSVYWALALSDQQYAMLLQRIQQATGAGVEAMTRAAVIQQVKSAFAYTAPYLAVVFTGADTSDTVYAYAVDSGGTALTPALPGVALINTGDGRWLMTGRDWLTSDFLPDADIASVVFTCDGRQTADIAWGGSGGLAEALGRTAAVTAGSDIVTITD